MPQVTMPERHKVVIIESERGWGSKVDDVLYFDNEPEARKYVADYNKDLPTDRTPDWYMIASYEGKVS